MKLYKVREILRVLKGDRWVLLRQKGSHQQYAHPTKKGLVTGSFHSNNDDLHPRIAKIIFNPAGLREEKK